MNINQLIRENIAAMKPYSSARDEFSGLDGLFLDANENPYNNGVNRYPDPYQNDLKSVLAELKGVAAKNMMLGNGSDEVLDLLFRAFCEPKQDNVVITAPSYGMYKVLANLNNVELKEVLLEEDFSLNADKILEVVDENTKLILLCSPNNPTGNVIDFEVIERLLNNTNCLVVVDEAYIDFSTKVSCIEKLSEYNQLVVSQTLSKYYGMAGIRLGMCFASEDIIAILNRIKPPYNVNSLTQNKAIDILKNKNERYKNEVIEERELLSKSLAKLPFVLKVYPSEANFVLIKTTDATGIYNQLIKKQIVIRNRTKEPLCENCLRITVGTPEENQLLIAALKEIKL
ncbi:MAG: histidinol-phosphate transaminase [Flavobacteriales bacterium]|nr:histidinol-phosphate transaminase [Flavobacteriales bacterium]MCB9173964.1 histidinol-phosphate transaminase [Flavobacteriales bacterium]